MVEHSFGGPWTEEKLTRLRKYLEAYTVIFTRNPVAARFRRVYVDAFAGTGIRTRSPDHAVDSRLPIFVLCFAAANERGAPTAVKIAGDLLGR